jgi:hypothetical protein
MVLLYLRDKFLSFVLPVSLVAGILGVIVWALGTTYFWDTSKLTINLPTDEITQVTITVQARIVHRDFVLL